MIAVGKNVAQGAATTMWTAVGRDLEGRGGMYLEDVREGQEVEKPHVVTGGYAAFAFDKEAKKRLWEISCEMTGTATEELVMLA